MKSYLLSVIVISVVKGICDIISPDLKSIKKYIKVIGALCVLCVVISPLISIVNDIDDGVFDGMKNELLSDQEHSRGELNEILNNYLNEYSIDMLKKELHAILEEKFQIPSSESEIIISTTKSNEKIEISEMLILLSGRSIFKNPYEIENYISTLLSCNCSVALKQ